MPIYTYRCENCGVRFDHTARFSDPPLARCPECGRKTLKKVYQPVGIVFKGSGFYATDHKSPSGGKKLPSHEEGKSEHASSSTDSAKESKSTPSSSESSSSSSSSSDAK